MYFCTLYACISSVWYHNTFLLWLGTFVMVTVQGWRGKHKQGILYWTVQSTYMYIDVHNFYTCYIVYRRPIGHWLSVLRVLYMYLHTFNPLDKLVACLLTLTSQKYVHSTCKCMYIHALQVNNRILFEGVLKIYWGVKNAIVLAPGAAYAKQRHNRQSIYDFVGVDDGAYLMMLEEASKARMRRELQDGEKNRLREIAENSLSFSGRGTCTCTCVCTCIYSVN